MTLGESRAQGNGLFCIANRDCFARAILFNGAEDSTYRSILGACISAPEAATCEEDLCEF